MVGSGGANDIASCARRTIIIMRHEERKLRQTISFVTSPGFVTGGDSRARSGLQGGPSRVITDKAIFGFDPETRKMTIVSIHPGNTVEDVVGSMGFAPLVPEKVAFTEPPDASQLKIIRETIDPDRMYMG
jgi:glutaconate CoA-transferase subunit B